MSGETSSQIRKYQALLAPGTPLRDGLERILRADTGALLVLGNNKKVKAACSGGFKLDVPFSATALRELAKMDGAIVLNSDLSTIVSAGVHLVPPGDLPTNETGTRHRSADRTAQYTDTPCITVSAAMGTIALFLDGERYAIPPSEKLLAKADQALATLDKYSDRLQRVLRELTSLEVRDQVTVRDLASVAQRYELVRRLSYEVEGYVIELGADGRLVALQLAEYSRLFDELTELLNRDYGDEAEVKLQALTDLDDEALLDLEQVAKAIGFTGSIHLDTRISAKGVRLLHTIGRLKPSLVYKIIDHFDSLQELLGANASELQEIEGIGSNRARMVRDGLMRLVEKSLLSEGHN